MGKIKIAPSQRKAAKGGKRFMKMVDTSIKVGSSVTKQVKKGYKKPHQNTLQVLIRAWGVP